MRTPRLALVPVALAASLLVGPGAAFARGPVPAPGAVAPPALLFHGNYCGPGNRGPNVPPTDALDAACMHHDACTPSDALPGCACHRRLRIEATRVAASPRESDDLRTLAGFVAQGSTLLACASSAPVPRGVPAR